MTKVSIFIGGTAQGKTTALVNAVRTMYTPGAVSTWDMEGYLGKFIWRDRVPKEEPAKICEAFWEMMAKVNQNSEEMKLEECFGKDVLVVDNFNMIFPLQSDERYASKLALLREVISKGYFKDIFIAVQTPRSLTNLYEFIQDSYLSLLGGEVLFVKKMDAISRVSLVNVTTDKAVALLDPARILTPRGVL